MPHIPSVVADWGIVGDQGGYVCGGGDVVRGRGEGIGVGGGDGMRGRGEGIGVGGGDGMRGRRGGGFFFLGDFLQWGLDLEFTGTQDGRSH